MIVLELYRRGTITSSRAAELLGTDRFSSIKDASGLGIPFIDMTEEGWDEEARLFQSPQKGFPRRDALESLQPVPARVRERNRDIDEEQAMALADRSMRETLDDMVADGRNRADEGARCAVSAGYERDRRTSPDARKRPGRGAMAVDTVRAELHELIDALAEADLTAAQRYLRYLDSGQADFLAWTLETAPVDDEPSSAEEDEGVEEAWQEYRRGETVSAEEAKRLLLP